MHREVSLPPWMKMSRKLSLFIERPRFAGRFLEEEARARGMRLAKASSGKIEEGDYVELYLLVDELDGVIADARFQVFGPPCLIGAAEAACELLMRKNYDQAKKISAELIDKQARDKKEKEAFPKEGYRSLNLLIEVIEQAALQCEDIPLSDAYVPTPMQPPSLEGGGYPGWDELSPAQQMAVLEEIITTEIRPYIELDEGGIEIVSLKQGRELVIAYQGACTTCYSSIGSTLQAIQQILSAKVHPDLRVIPDSSFLRVDPNDLSGT